MEPRYTLNRDSLSLKNRHMVKCYPSFKERIEKIDEFKQKIKFYKDMLGKQRSLLNFLSEYYEESNENTKINADISFTLEPFSKSITKKRNYSFSDIPSIDPSSWMKNSKTLPSSSKYNYNKKLFAKPPCYDSLHESTLYLDHYC